MAAPEAMMSMTCLELCRPLALAALLAWSAAAPAGENDAQAIEWSADGSSSMSTESGVRSLRMRENVVIIRDGLEIRGDEAVIEYRTETNELSRITVLGAPARYRQALGDESVEEEDDEEGGETGGPVTGSGDTILVYSDAEGNSIVELIGNAAIRSNDMETNCETIVYVAEIELIRASGNCAGAFAPRDD